MFDSSKSRPRYYVLLESTSSPISCLIRVDLIPNIISDSDQPRPISCLTRVNLVPDVICDPFQPHPHIIFDLGQSPPQYHISPDQPRSDIMLIRVNPVPDIMFDPGHSRSKHYTRPRPKPDLTPTNIL